MQWKLELLRQIGDERVNKAVDKHYGSKYNKELTDDCHAFLEKTIPNGKERVEKVVQTLY